MLLRGTSLNELFRDWHRLQDQLGHAFSERGVTFSGAGPLVNVCEDADHVYAEVDLPGVDAEKIDVSVTEGNQLTITGERPVLETSGAVWHRQERFFGTFTRGVTLPTLVNADKVTATYEAGMLKLTMPKAEAAKPRKIAVKSV